MSVKKAPTKRPVWVIPVAALVLVVVVLSIVFFSFFTTSPTDALDALAALNTKGSHAQLKAMAPDAYWTYLETCTGIKTEDLLLEYGDEWNDYLSLLHTQYGNDIRTSYNVISETDHSGASLRSIADALSSQFSIDAKTVTAVKTLQVELTVSGSESAQTTPAEYTVAMISGNWYVIYVSQTNEIVSVYFHTFG